MNNFIKKIQFKKVVCVYIIIAILVGISLILFIGNVFHDKIAFIYNYHMIGEKLQSSKNNLENIKEEIKILSDNSEDVVDVLILDKENRIIYSSKNSKFALQNEFTLTKADNMSSDYFVIPNDDTAIFRLTTNKELIINTVLSNFDTEIQNESEDQIFYESNFNTKQVYLLSYVANQDTGEKIYFINEIKPVQNGKTYIKVTLAIMMFFFMLYWVLLAIYIYQNALKSKLNPYLWGGITLITNIAGVIIYIIYKQNQKTCFKCGASQDKNNIYCIYCGTKLNETCNVCGTVINTNDKYCAKCGHQQKNEE